MDFAQSALDCFPSPPGPRLDGWDATRAPLHCLSGRRFSRFREIIPLIILSSVSDAYKAFPTLISLIPTSPGRWVLIRQSLLKNFLFERGKIIRGTWSEEREGSKTRQKLSHGSSTPSAARPCRSRPNPSPRPIEISSGSLFPRKKKRQSGKRAETQFSLKKIPGTGARPNSYWTGRTGRRDGFRPKRPRSTGFSFWTCPIRVGRDLSPSSPLLSERRFSHFPRKQTIASSNRVPTCLAPFSTTSHPFPSLPTLHSASASPL